MQTCRVVDASDVIRKAARHLFQARKFANREADNGQAALEQCQLAMPDAIPLVADAVAG